VIRERFLRLQKLSQECLRVSAAIRRPATLLATKSRDGHGLPEALAGIPLALLGNLRGKPIASSGFPDAGQPVGTV
jgi:hypothetical protein